jgi:membrane protease YdiL (CAAX protease family)
MADASRDTSMQEHAFNITTCTFIDIPGLLLQSEGGAGFNRTTNALLCVCALVAGTVVWRQKLLPAPREAAGRLPQDAFLGVIAMLGFMLVGALGANASRALAIADADYARLAQGAFGNIAQLALALLAVQSALFVDAARAAARPRTAVTEGALGFLLATPIVLALGLLIAVAMAWLGIPPAPKASHETLRILGEKGDALFTVLTLAHVAILVPLAEEAGWRGLLQPSLRRAGLGGSATVLATAILFAAIHWSAIPAEGRVAGMPMLLALGYALGLLRERTGGILAPTVLHALFNALNVWITLASDG